MTAWLTTPKSCASAAPPFRYLRTLDLGMRFPALGDKSHPEQVVAGNLHRTIYSRQMGKSAILAELNGVNFHLVAVYGSGVNGRP